MLSGFIDVMRRMVAEGAAAQILQGIGAMFPGGSFLGTLFGGAFRSLLGGGSLTGGIVWQTQKGDICLVQ
jgi:hypothetical protein